MLTSAVRRWRTIALITTLFAAPAALAHAHLKNQYPAAGGGGYGSTAGANAHLF